MSVVAMDIELLTESVSPTNVSTNIELLTEFPGTKKQSGCPNISYLT